MIRHRIFPIVFLLLFTAHARANVYTVGNGCPYASIASAVADAESHPGADIIHVAYNRTYDQQSITISTAQQLDIVGGFADCSQAASDGSQTAINGSFQISVDTGGLVRLSYLSVQYGNAQDFGKGGGIYFTGNGTLELQHATVAHNTAGFGGGIYAEGAGATTKLVIGQDVAIVDNTARYDGGGVVNDGATVTMTAPDSYIAFNHAQGMPVEFAQYGFGGGILILSGGGRKAHTFIGSSGLGNVGAIYLNDALFGGGVAVRATDNESDLNVFSIDAARPMRIKGNSASYYGGGVYLGEGGNLPVASLNVWYAYLEDNVAAQGAAIRIVTQSGSIFFNDPAHRPLGSIDCPIGRSCGGINGNLAQNDQSQLSGGIIQTTAGSTAHFHRMEMRGNTGAFVFNSSGAPNIDLEMHHVTVTDNTTLLALISTIDDHGLDGFVDIEDTTIAGNAIGNNKVLQFSNAGGSNKLYRSIIWQPGMMTLQNDGLPFDLLDDMVGERSSIDPTGTASVIEQDPRFVDPAHGDYSLRAGSPAIDYAAGVANDGQDLNSNPRDVDLPVIVNFHGKRDLGAIERQTLQPIVLNPDFDTDLGFWSTVIAGVTTWDASRNASGAAGSGSAHMTLPNAGNGAGGLVQCVLLPAPGTYELNGWGHGTGTMVTAGDIAELYWEFRKSGGENCTSGAPDATGTKILSNGNSWTRPATPASIEVTAQDWTSTSSIAVTLVAVENGASGGPTNAWFDGVTLRIEGDDGIFGNGFENP